MIKLKPNESAERTANGDELMLSDTAPQDVGMPWRPISTAPRGETIALARKGGQRDDGSTYWYQAIGHFGLMDGFFHRSYGQLYGAPELWAPYPKNPEHCPPGASPPSDLEITQAEIMAIGDTVTTLRSEAAKPGKCLRLEHGIACDELAAAVSEREHARFELAQRCSEETAEWVAPVATVADLVNNLLTVDQSLPIHAAYFVDIDGKKQCRTKHVIFSRERVSGNRIRAGDEDTPYSIVVWSAQDEEPVWRDGSEIPPVKLRGEREYVVAVKRAHSGKIYSFSASYLNATPLRYEWGCPNGSEDMDRCKKCTDDGCPTTGWYLLTGNDGEGGQYESLDLRDGDQLMGWREIPRWEYRTCALPSTEVHRGVGASPVNPSAPASSAPARRPRE